MAILGPPGAPFATSHSDFLGARRAGSVCVDKTAFVADVIDAGHGAVLLLPRPRRFGKTTNLSMLRAFFERSLDDTTDAFEGTEIWGMGEAYRRHFRAHPVIWLSFKDVKFQTWSEAHAALHLMMRGVIGETLGSHAPALRAGLRAALRTPGVSCPKGSMRPFRRPSISSERPIRATLRPSPAACGRWSRSSTRRLASPSSSSSTNMTRR